MQNALVLPYRGVMPKIHPSAFIAPGAVIVGDVEIGEHSSVWFNAVIRADMSAIRIGARTNIQDGAVIHVSADKRGPVEGAACPPKEGYATFIGDDVTIGHCAVVHACAIETGAFIGMKALVMDGARVEGDGLLAAGAVLTPAKTVRSGEVWMGNPAKFVRELSPDERKENRSRADEYAALARDYLKEVCT